MFAASVSHLDSGIGKIIDALERTGKRENTLILFLSDNGGQHSWHSNTEYRGKYADKPHSVLGNNYPLRGWKSDLYEGGIRVPAIANWPGELEPGVADFPVHMTDWLPTLANLLGIEKDTEEISLDGKNIWPLLTGEQVVADERTLYWKTNQNFVVRKGNWKLLVHRNSGQTELFNLENDFRETRDLSENNPEIAEQLKKLLEAFQKDDREKK